MLPLLISLFVAQTQPAIRRSTPLVDDPGMVVRQAGPIVISGTLPVTDGGNIGTVNQGVGLTDGGSWTVNCLNCSGGSSGSGWVPDGGYIGTVSVVGVDGGLSINVIAFVAFDGGYVTVTNAWAPDGGAIGSVTVSNFPATQPVSAVSLPLPTGASTSALQTTGNTSLNSIDTKTLAAGQATMAASSPVVIASNQSAIPTTLASTTITGSVAVTGPLTDTQLRATPVPVSGSVTTDGLTDTQLRATPVPVSGTVTANAGTGTMTVGQATGSNLHVVVDTAPTTAITAAALPLPTGAATSALQTTGNTSVASIDTKTPVQGQAAMAASSPVVIASNQTAFPVTVASTTITGTVAATESGVWSTRTQDGAGNALASSTTTPTGTEQALIVRNLPSGTQAVSGSVGITGTPAVTITSGTTTVTQATGTNLHTVTDTGSTTAVTGTVAVSGPLTDTQLRASAVPVSLTSTTITGTVAATESGTWTVQPGNTANTTPWLTTDTPRTVASANNPGNCVSVTVSTTVLASNASRKSYGFKAADTNTANVHCKLGATATTSNTTFAKGAAWSQDTGAVYTGVIDCIAASGTQSVCPYEFN